MSVATAGVAQAAQVAVSYGKRIGLAIAARRIFRV